MSNTMYNISNTAIPKYYAEYREKVLSGEILVPETISLQMNRVDRLIADKNIYYNPAIVDGFISFCENEMTLTDGSPVHMLLTFKVLAEQIFGFWYYENRSIFIRDRDAHGGHYIQKRIPVRLINKIFIKVARGFSKTTFMSWVHAYFLIIDGRTTSQVAVAPTMHQAEETLSPIITAINRAPGPVIKFMTMGSLQNTTGNAADRKQLASTKEGIRNFMTNSILRILPMSINKLQGLRDKICSVDEWLSGDIREDPIAALEEGASKQNNPDNDDWLIMAVSSEGTVRNGPGDTIKMELMRILKGEQEDIHSSIWLYQLDDIKEVSDPNMWEKANPNIGYTVSYETYQRDVERMEHEPAVRNEILAKRFGIPMEGFTYYFTYDETIPHRRHDFRGLACTMGADLSQGDDFCAFTFLFPLRDGTFGVKTKAYISSKTADLLPGALRLKYQDFVNEGSLSIFDGTVLDMMDVYDDVNQYINDHDLSVIGFGYDPYNAKEFVGRWETEYGSFGVEKVIQGARTESVPLGELKKLASDRALIFDQTIIQFTMGNAIAIEDTNGNRKLYKKRSDQKIDCVAALLDAWVAYRINRESF